MVSRLPLHQRKKTKKKRRKLGQAKVDVELSLVEAAAKKIFDAAREVDTDLVYYDLLLKRKGSEPWIAVYRRLHQLRTSLVFSRILGDTMSYVKGDLSHIQRKRGITTGLFLVQLSPCGVPIQCHERG